MLTPFTAKPFGLMTVIVPDTPQSLSVPSSFVTATVYEVFPLSPPPAEYTVSGLALLSIVQWKVRVNDASAVFVTVRSAAPDLSVPGSTQHVPEPPPLASPFGYSLAHSA